MSCEGVPLEPVVTPLRRLTPDEYRNTVRDLFPGATVPAVELAQPDIVGGFDNNASAQAVTPLLVEQYLNAAEAVADVVTPSVGAWGPCDGSTDPAACGETV